MRFIDNRHIQAPAGWDARAAQALDDVRNNRCQINERSAVWSALKDALAGLSHDKCWYCESRQVRSDDAVDHFRPKNRIEEAGNTHPGYWWLAFEKGNFRYSCTFCNSRRKNPETGNTQGKGDSFPLLNGGRHATVPQNVANEQPALIDPCNSYEPFWIDFRTDGTPCPKFPTHPIRAEKALKSIYYYHLDHPDTVEERRKLAVQIESWIEEADEQFLAIEDGGILAERFFANRVRDIQATMRGDAEYSAFARRIVAAHRDKEWVEVLYQTI